MSCSPSNYWISWAPWIKTNMVLILFLKFDWVFKPISLRNPSLFHSNTTHKSPSSTPTRSGTNKHHISSFFPSQDF